MSIRTLESDFRRYNPLDKQEAKVDSGEHVHPERQTAGVSLDDVSVCPKCKQPMRYLLSARGKIPSYVCMEHKVVLPVPDSKISQ